MDRIAAQDDWVNEFISFGKSTPVGGEYNMPVTTALEELNRIYGEGSTLERLSAEDDEEEGRVSQTEFRTMNQMRKKRTPNKYAGARPRRSQFRVGNMPGISKYIGSLPDHELSSPDSDMGVHGGSASDDYQEVWMSGGSVSFSFDPDDQPEVSR
eukprot:UN0263